MVIHHTDCGLATATDEQLRRILMQNRDLPPPPRQEIKEKEVGDVGKEKALRDLNGMKFGSISKGKEEASLKEDVEFLRNSGWFTGMGIWGGLMNTETGLIREVISYEGEGGK
jgi:carbonic anhydrase